MIKDIKKHKNDNLGGIHSFIFTPVENVLDIPPVISGSVRMAITLKAGTRWYRGHGIEGTMRFTDEPQEDENGTFYQKRLIGLIAKKRASLVDQLTSMKNRRFIVIARDYNDIMWLIGNKSEPLLFKSGSDSKEHIPGRNEISFEFFNPGIDESPVFSGLCPLLGFE